MKKIFNKLGIRAKVLLIVLIPLVVVINTIVAYFTFIRIQDVQESLHEVGRLIAQQVSNDIDLALFAGDRDRLRAAIIGLMNIEGVAAIVIRDENRDALVQTGAFDELDQAKIILHSEPVRLKDIRVTDFDAQNYSGKNKSPVIGWVDVAISPAVRIDKQMDVVYQSLLITLISLIIVAYLALSVSSSIVTPLMRIKNYVDKMRKGQFALRIDTTRNDELGELEDGINNLAATLENVHQEMNKQIRFATADLRRTVQALEEKNKELDFARKQALEASQSKMEFLARMSHEIRTPINAIMGFSRLIGQVDSLQQKEEYMGIVETSTQQLTSIIDDILDYSKLQGSSVELEKISFDLRECLENVLAMNSASALEKNLELILLLDSDVPEVFVGDPTRLNQVLSNLVSNAIKFSENGIITIQVEIVSKTHYHAGLKIRVTDAGIGISEHQKTRLFHAFTQADESITRRFGGAGLGLVIARKLVELMDGQIGVESEAGSGSVFWFTVSLAINKAKKAGLGINASGQEILLLDSNALSRRSIRNTLISQNVNVFSLSSLDQLVHKLSHKKEKGDTAGLLLSLRFEELRGGSLIPLITSIRRFYQDTIILLYASRQFRLPDPLLADNKLLCVAKPVRREALLRYLGEYEQLPSRFCSLAAESSAIGSADYKDLRILVVDDNEFNLMLVSTLLRRKGIQVTEFRDSRQALESYFGHNYDFVLLDLHMPDMDGFQLAKNIRQVEKQGFYTTVLALTADVFSVTDIDLAEQGINDYLIKPITEDALFGVIDKWLKSVDDDVIVQKQLPCEGAVVDNILKLDDELKHKLYSDIRTSLVQLQQSLEQRDQDNSVHLAHRFFGVVGYFGLHELLELSRQLEKSARDGDWEFCSGCLVQLRDLCEPLLQTLAASLEEAVH